MTRICHWPPVQLHHCPAAPTSGHRAIGLTQNLLWLTHRGNLPEPRSITPAKLRNRADRDLLTSTFETVRTRFFPRWNRDSRWKCRINRRMAGGGICCLATKTIYIDPRVDNLIGTLIHETCHALNPRVNHGGGWQRRMLIAASTAEQLGELALAEYLRSEVIQYRTEAEIVTARTIYSQIEQIVEESTANPSFESIVGLLAPKYLMNRRKFLKRFRRAKQTYQSAIAFRDIRPPRMG